MSNIWPHVTKQNPCPICGKDDWCQIGDKAIKCMRIESLRPCKGGGWYHFQDDGVPHIVIPKKKSVQVIPINIESTILFWSSRKDHDALIHGLAFNLGVSIDSLLLLGVVWAQQYDAYAFPMRDGLGNAVGIRLRNKEGKKWAVTGSRQGLFFAQSIEWSDPVYICEGPTDTAAAMTIGLNAIGRPSCNCSCEQLIIALHRIGARRVVIIADHDAPKANGAMPGLDGARKLKKELPIRSTILLLQQKDIREFVNMGGTKEMIESDVRLKVFTKG